MRCLHVFAHAIAIKRSYRRNRSDICSGVNQRLISAGKIIKFLRFTAMIVSCHSFHFADISETLEDTSSDDHRIDDNLTAQSNTQWITAAILSESHANQKQIRIGHRLLLVAEGTKDAYAKTIIRPSQESRESNCRCRRKYHFSETRKFWHKKESVRQLSTAVIPIQRQPGRFIAWNEQ